MSALRFIKTHGVDRAKRELSYKNTMMSITSDEVFFNELAKLVKSHDIVEENGGFDLLCRKYRTAEKLDSELVNAIKDVHSFTA